MNFDVNAVFDLSPAEKLQLIEDLWNDLTSTPENVPIHDWQREELDRRKANLINSPGSGLTWEEVLRRVRSRAAGLSGGPGREMKYRSPLRIRNAETSELRVIVEPWATEIVLQPGEECEVVVLHPSHRPSLNVVVSPHVLIVEVHDGGSLYELWYGGRDVS